MQSKYVNKAQQFSLQDRLPGSGKAHQVQDALI